MKRSVQPRLLLAASIVALILSPGCARSEPKQNAAESLTATRQTLPFHQEGDQVASGDDIHPAVSPDSNPAPNVPFRDSSHIHTLPAGTLLTVELQNTLSSRKLHEGDLFSVLLAAPLKLNGNTLIGRDTAITGRIEAMRAPAPGLSWNPVPGYFRLTLQAINFQARSVAIRTSSLFARGNLPAPQLSNTRASSAGAAIRLEKGHRLTFRLVAPLALADGNTMATIPVAKPNSE